MKTRTFVLLGLAVGLALVLTAAAAAQGPGDSAVEQPTRQGLGLPSANPSPPPSTADYLIALPVVPPDPAEIPPHLSPEQAAEYARSLTYRQAQPIMAELERLRAEGLITGFEVRPDLHGVVVKDAVPEAPEQLSRFQGMAALMPHSEASPSACAVAAAQALPEQVLGLSHVAAGSAPRLQATGLAPQATDPSINASAEPGGTGNTWSYINHISQK